MSSNLGRVNNGNVIVCYAVCIVIVTLLYLHHGELRQLLYVAVQKMFALNDAFGSLMMHYEDDHTF